MFGKRLFAAASAIWGGVSTASGVAGDPEIENLTEFLYADENTDFLLAESIV